MRLNKASILSVCLLALRVGVAAAPTENINAALVFDEDHNTTSVAEGHLHLENAGIEFPNPVAELEKRKGRSSSSRTSRKPSKTTKKKVPKKKKKTTKKKTTTKKTTPKKTTPKKKKPTKSKTAAPKVTSKAKLSPTKSKSMSKTASKTKSAKDPYGSCKPKKGAKGTKGTKTKGKKGGKREEQGFTPISDEQYHVSLFCYLGNFRLHPLTGCNRVSQPVIGKSSKLAVLNCNSRHIPLVEKLSLDRATELMV